jgi:hypothetical protein
MTRLPNEQGKKQVRECVVKDVRLRKIPPQQWILKKVKLMYLYEQFVLK